MAKEEAKKFCKLVKKDYLKTNLEAYSCLVKNPKFVCTKCGRAAEDKGYLCKAEKLD